ncbi:hypothetical protein Lrub_1331 [Legionella rubrilucens]|uniref:Uncharacterized protein n=1 Tax=Legionella rubrilucens TaxID=458 RepID=A0A0W0XXB5_9GAMM|nr:DUF5993 family protein [Legionella rubrilucens]KTD48980.1 hypothetical protein Lrub_1331 [Legionella rubrilucens]
MMAFLFLVLALAVSLAWAGRRNLSFATLVFALLLGTASFLHHITSQLNLNL